MSKIIAGFKMVCLLKNWYLYFLDHFRFIKKDKILIYKLRNGLKIKTRAGNYEGDIIHEIFNEKVYTFSDAVYSPIAEIIDVGAHIGVFSLYISQLLNHKCKIYAFEPLPQNFELLKENIKINGLKNIIPINKAVSSKEEITFYVHGNMGWSLLNKRILYKGLTKTNGKKFKAISIGQIIQDYKIGKVDLLKIDCEGGEYGILSSEILQNVGYVGMEFHNLEGHNVSSLVKLFKENNFYVEKTGVVPPYFYTGILKAKNEA